jgi:F-type H+-transporting ATPase subunit gamma
MPNLKDIRKRIRSVKNTQKITRAMKLVAASKLRRSQEAIEAARPYATKIREVVTILASGVKAEDHPLLRTSESPEKALLLVVTSDKGLCGPFNTNLLRRVDRYLKERTDLKFDLVVIGKKGAAFFRRTKHNVAQQHPEVLLRGANAQIARDFTATLSEKFVSGEYDQVFLAYNEFKSVISQEQRIERILPVSPDKVESAEGGDALDFIFEPDKNGLLEVLLPKYVETAVFRAMLDSVASEHGSRMNAMDNATRNASEMLQKLTLTYNRARQAAITKELVEITTGAQALQG